jgi:hypothetical protein
MESLQSSRHPYDDCRHNSLGCYAEKNSNASAEGFCRVEGAKYCHGSTYYNPSAYLPPVCSCHLNLLVNRATKLTTAGPRRNSRHSRVFRVRAIRIIASTPEKGGYRRYREQNRICVAMFSYSCGAQKKRRTQRGLRLSRTGLPSSPPEDFHNFGPVPKVIEKLTLRAKEIGTS